MQPMNNRQNGRRRGRNNNQRPQGGGQSRGGGDSGNRIDSRSRGNAAQLLEKYKNLAREAQMSGDRVQLEYYLQFADHYFRVLADSRSRQEEQRPGRADERFDERDGVDEGVPFGFGDEGDAGEPGDEPRGQTRERDQGRHRDRDQPRDTERNRDRARRAERRDDADDQDDNGADAARMNGDDGRPSDREERPTRRDNGRARRRPFGERDEGRDNGGDLDRESAAIDIAVLPPAIGATPPEAEPAAPPVRRRTVRARKPAADEGVPAEG